MGKWHTNEERLAYHREYNAKYRLLCPDKIKQYKQNVKIRVLEIAQIKELEERKNPRATFLLDEYDEGGVV